MARLSYSAPGVYVEEVPSARQPIAGVGTNTVAFIGIVPDKIFLPRTSTKYDPMKEQQTHQRRFDAAGKSLVAAVAARQKAGNEELAILQNDAKAAAEDVKAKTKVREEAKAARAALAAGADPKAADAALAEAEKALKAATEAQDAVNQKVKEKKAGVDASAGSSETEDLGDTAPAAEYVVKNPEDHPEDRPYYFEEFSLRVEEFDTKLCTNFSEYADRFGDFSGFTPDPVADDVNAMWRFRPLSPGHHMLTHAVNGFFKNGGTRCFVARVKSAAGLKKALARFESIDEVAIVAAPGLPKNKEVWEELQAYCEDANHQNVFAILDLPGVIGGADGEFDTQKLTYDDKDKSVLPRMCKYAAVYFPYIEVSDPAKRLQDEDPVRGVAPKYRGLTHVPPSGHMAGLYARIDEERGVHKAPANAVVRGALEVKYYVSKAKQAGLNPQGVNCLRIMDGAVVAWGARTIGGDRNGEWKYINVRRFAGFLEESIDEGTQWVVFEPNDPTLWSKIRLNITSFLTNVWRNGALFGLTPEEAFYVKCDAELNPPEVRDLGQVITEIGVAIVRPAEFVIFRISQSTGAQKS